jgi:polyisoprenoid-binding protein YceI
MKKSAFIILVVLVFLGLREEVFALDTLMIDATHSTIGFRIRHIVSRVTGRFAEFSGTVLYDDNDMTKMSLEIVVQTKSIDTDNDNRDKHLRSTDFFAADSIPAATFKSVRVYKNNGKLLMDGTLTIKSIAKDITIPVEVVGITKVQEKPIIGLSSTFMINRKDFDVTWNRALDNGGVLLGDEVEMTIDIEARTPRRN